MARPKNEHCNKCGILKTEENTYYRDRTKRYFQDKCKICGSAVSAARYYNSLSAEEKEMKKEKYIRLSEKFI